ncbi:hypothetical protein [Streptomyces sp. NPDC008125]|uniref:hypothetical protein n=1 Tax=Streptomyces sp. NPDC008125 TaxID=3364811 RepID=UPI0036E10470
MILDTSGFCPSGIGSEEWPVSPPTRTEERPTRTKGSAGGLGGTAGPERYGQPLVR